MFPSNEILNVNVPSLQEPDPHCASCHGTFVEQVSLNPSSNVIRVLVCSYARMLIRSISIFPLTSHTIHPPTGVTSPIRHLSHSHCLLQLGEGGDDDPRSFARENENAERIENIFLGLAGLMASAPTARSPRPTGRNQGAFPPHFARLGDASPGPGTRTSATAPAAEIGEQRGIRWSTPGGGIRLEVRSGIEPGAGRTRTWAYTTGGGPQESQGNAGAGFRNAANLPTNFPSFPE